MLVVIALASALVFREDLAQVALRDQLTELGLKDARFRVERFTTDTITIADFSAGPAMSFDRLTVGYSAREILRGRVARIELTGLQVDMTQPGPWAGLGRKSGGKSDRGAGSPLDPSILPTIDIRRARLRIAGPGGPMNITATAHLQPDPEGTLAFQAKASTAGPTGKIEMGYEGKIRVGADGGTTAVGRLQATSPSLATSEIQIRSLQIALPLSIDLTTVGATIKVSEDARFETGGINLASDLSTGPINGSLSGILTSTFSSGEWFDAKVDIAVDAREIRAGDLAARHFTSPRACRGGSPCRGRRRARVPVSPSITHCRSCLHPSPCPARRTFTQSWAQSRPADASPQTAPIGGASPWARANLRVTASLWP
jgi:hypothetical protein